MQRQTIGILAGMGPHSTAPFIDLIVEECKRQYGAKDDIDFPKMMIYSLPTPFYADRPIDHAAMEAALRSGLQDIERFGVGFTAIACNTAHIYHPQLAKSISSPLLNMIELTLDAIPSTARKVAIIAARPTAESEIYQIGIRTRGYESVDLDWQSKIDVLIEHTRTTNDSSVFRKYWKDLTTMALQAGVDTIIVACLDLSAIRIHIESDIRILEASHCLASGIVKEWLEPTERKVSSEPLRWQRDNFILTTDKNWLDFKQVHHFLSRQAYWSLGIPFEIVQKAAQSSLCFSLFNEAKSNRAQIGFARVVSDYATFAWLCDVYVEPAYREKGLAKWVMGCVMGHPDLQGLRRICLATKDAHSLYKQFGFKLTETPANWMEIKDNDLYTRMSGSSASLERPNNG